MHNFGLSDAAVEPSESENPVELLRVFTHDLLSESPEMKRRRHHPHSRYSQARADRGSRGKNLPTSGTRTGPGPDIA
jgi:hypothetical protein